MAAASNKQSAARLRALTAVFPARKAYYESSGIQSRDLGVPAPVDGDRPTAAANGAGGVNGTVSYKITYYAETWDTEGNPHATAASITVASKTVRLTFNDTPPTWATHRRVYRTVDGGSDYFRVASVAKASATYDDTTADATLTSLTALSETNHEPVAGMQGVIELGARLFAFKESKLYGSKASNPDQWPALNVLQVARDNGDDIQCLAAHGDNVVIYKDSSIHTLVYNIDPFDISDAYVQPNHYGRGALNWRCVVRYGAIHVVLDREGIYLYAGAGEVVDISQQISPIFAQLDWGQGGWFCGVRSGARARFFVARAEDGGSATDARLHWAIVLDLESLNAKTGPVFWLEHYDAPLRDACEFEFGSDSDIAAGASYRCAVAIDKYGTVFCLDHLTSDGALEELTCEGAVASWSETNTRCNVTDGVFASADFGAYDLTRLFVRFTDPDGVISEALRISAVGAGYFDFASAPDPLPAVGSSFVIGNIHGIWRSKELDFGRPFERKFGGHVALGFAARPFDVDARVRILRDRAGAAPMGRSSDMGGHEGQEGDDFQRFSIGGQPATRGGEGVTDVPLGSENCYSLTFELEVWGAHRALSLHSLEVAGGSL